MEPVDVKRPKQIRVVVVGDPKVGKSSLIEAFRTENCIPSQFAPSAPLPAINKLVKFDGNQYELIVVDTSELDKTRLAAYMYADIALLLYSAVNKASFKNVAEKWTCEIKTRLKKPFLLVSTQIDIRDRPDTASQLLDSVINYDGMKACSEQGGGAFMETSARTLEGVSALFDEVPVVFEREWARLLERPIPPPSSPVYDLMSAPFGLVQRCTPVFKQCYVNVKECITNPNSFVDHKKTVLDYVPSVVKYYTQETQTLNTPPQPRSKSSKSSPKKPPPPKEEKDSDSE